MLWAPPAAGEAARFAPFDSAGADTWLQRLLEMGPITVPRDQASTLAERLATSGITRVDCPEELRVERAALAPVPVLRLRRAQSPYRYGAQRYGAGPIDCVNSMTCMPPATLANQTCPVSGR